MMGLGLVWVLAVLGGLREIVGTGTLFSGIDMIFPDLSAWNLLGDDYPGFLIAILPPGAFFALGCLIALFNWINARMVAQHHAHHEVTPAATSEAPAPQSGA
jgi:electron transport complex protein RnfE